MVKLALAVCPQGHIRPPSSLGAPQPPPTPASARAAIGGQVGEDDRTETLVVDLLQVSESWGDLARGAGMDRRMGVSLSRR
jgi:hypothetical protein